MICCRGTADTAAAAMRAMMAGLRLTVNETKTRTCRVLEETFDFLGYTFGRRYSKRTRRWYLGSGPSRKRVSRLCAELSARTARRTLSESAAGQVRRLNQTLSGWANYFCLGPVRAAYRAVDAHTRFRLRQWLRRKHKLAGRGYSRFPDSYLYEALHLLRLEPLAATCPWAKA